jgi:putative ABC transport system ATP-binding protein
LEQKPIISVRGLRKVYQVGDEKVVALGNINLEILQGQIVCIVGTSGSGKSTLLNQLAGLEKPTRGAVYIGKTNISKLNENQLAIFRQHFLGFVFQSYNLLPTMTALENVALPMIFKGIGRRKRNKAALKMLAAVGLKKRAYHKPTQMSGGQQQRVGIARAFVSHPKVVFADEPTGNLDTHTTIDVMKMMVRFARRYDQTLIIVTHDAEIADYADRVITLIDGEIRSDLIHEPIYDGLSEQDRPEAAPLPELPEGEPPALPEPSGPAQDNICSDEAENKGEITI